MSADDNHVLAELQRYVSWSVADEAALRALAPRAAPALAGIAEHFYGRILEHPEASRALSGGESQLGRLKCTLVDWMQSLLVGPWDDAYYERRARIGRAHVRIALPQHYMFGAMNVIRQQLDQIAARAYADQPSAARAARVAVAKILDLELAIMLHTYREDLLAQQARQERLATFGQLVGSIGHELRNPLGVMESSLYIVKRHLGAGDSAHKHVTRLEEQLALANRIVSDLLDMIGDRPLEVAPIELATLVDAALASIEVPREVRVVYAGLDGLPTIRGDASKLRQVIVNLVENALHAVGAVGEVWLRGETSAGQLVLAVEDSGPGVDAGVRARLFEPLITTKPKGVGLGLALVRRIVERHHGTIGYEPAATGGARFVLRLPLAAA